MFVTAGLYGGSFAQGPASIENNGSSQLQASIFKKSFRPHMQLLSNTQPAVSTDQASDVEPALDNMIEGSLNEDQDLERSIFKALSTEDEHVDSAEQPHGPASNHGGADRSQPAHEPGLTDGVQQHHPKGQNTTSTSTFSRTATAPDSEGDLDALRAGDEASVAEGLGGLVNASNLESRGLHHDHGSLSSSAASTGLQLKQAAGSSQADADDALRPSQSDSTLLRRPDSSSDVTNRSISAAADLESMLNVPPIAGLNPLQNPEARRAEELLHQGWETKTICENSCEHQVKSKGPLMGPPGGSALALEKVLKCSRPEAVAVCLKVKLEVCICMLNRRPGHALTFACA